MDANKNNSAEVVREFWSLMASNDFDSVRAVLAEDLVVDWPQSNERIRGATNFARVNSEYPSSGAWQFSLKKIVASDGEVVTDVEITDGHQQARALSFFTVCDGKIVHMREYWPEPYTPPENRGHLVESMERTMGASDA